MPGYYEPVSLQFLRWVLFFLIPSALAVAAGHPSHYARFNGMRVHYESYGSGPEALVFIHGWTCDLTFWREQEPVYTAHRSLLIDLPGHGKSDKPHIAYSTALFARAIAAVMKDAGVERAVLVGHSLGGNISYSFVRLYPEKTEAVVIVDAVVSKTPAKITHEAVVQNQKRAKSLVGPEGEKSFAKQVNAMFSDRSTPEMQADIRKKMLATPEYVRASAVTSPSIFPPTAPLDGFDIPALAVVSIYTAERAAQMRPIFPQLEVEKWDGYGHFLMMEDPERFNQTLEEFLESLPAMVEKQP